MSDTNNEVCARMQSGQEFCLRWNDHQSTLLAIFGELLDSSILVDCTLAAEGQCLKAHKVVLSACSPYFQLLLSQHTDKHPIVILKDVKFDELKAMMDYMYRGEVNIPQDQLAPLLKTAESLQIRGLGGTSNQNGNVKSEKPRQFDKGALKKDQAGSRLGSGSPAPRPLSSGVGDALNSSQASTSRRGSLSPTPRKRIRHHRSAEGGDAPQSTSGSREPPPQSLSPLVPDLTSVTSLALLSGSSRTVNSPRFGEWSEVNTEKSSPLPAPMDDVSSLAPLSSFSSSIVESSGNREWSDTGMRSPASSGPNNSLATTSEDSKLAPISEILLVPKTEYEDVEDDSLTNAMLEDVQDFEASGPSHADGSLGKTAFVPWLENIETMTDETTGQAVAAAYRASQVNETMGIMSRETSGNQIGKLRGNLNSCNPTGRRRGGRKLSGLYRKKKESMTEEEKEQLRKYERERKRIQRAKKAVLAQTIHSSTSSSLWGTPFTYSESPLGK